MVLSFEEQDADKDIVKDVLTLGIYLIFLLVSAYFSLTAGKGLEEDINFTAYAVFSSLILAFIVFAFIIKFVQSHGYAKTIFLNIHDPEKGFFNNKVITNGLALLFLSLMITSLMGFIGALRPESSVTNFLFPLNSGITPQQTTPGAKVFFSFFNAPAENFFLYVLIGIIVTTEFVIFKRLLPKVSLTTIFLIFLLPNIILGSFGWLEIHNLVSQGNDIEGIGRVAFGAQMSTAYLLTGSVIYPETLHIINNLFVTVKKTFGFSSLLILFTTLMLVSISGFLYVMSKISVKE